jgi:hypothetical protein
MDEIERHIVCLVSFGKDSAANRMQLEKFRCTLLEQIILYGGANLISSAAPGQHVALSRPFSVQDQFDCVTLALAKINGQPTIVSNLYPVFW